MDSHVEVDRPKTKIYNFNVVIGVVIDECECRHIADFDLSEICR